MRWLSVLVAVGAVTVWSGIAQPAGAADEAGMKVGEKSVMLEQGGKTMLEYCFAGVPFKPYMRTLATPAGINILRDAPSDHLHHHGLMFAWRVNGVNFWEEKSEVGREVHRKIESAGGGFVEKIEWLAPVGEDVLLLEERRVEMVDSGDPAARLLVWRSTFTVPAGKPSAAITGAHYHGLGMRFLKEMDNAGQFINAEGKKSEVFRGTEMLVPGASWCAYVAAFDGKEVTAALLDHPQNPRPATFFTMTKPFAYLSAALNLHKDPLTIEQGKPLTFTWGVVVADGKLDAARIGKIRERWLASKEPAR